MEEVTQQQLLEEIRSLHNRVRYLEEKVARLESKLGETDQKADLGNLSFWGFGMGNHFR